VHHFVRDIKKIHRRTLARNVDVHLYKKFSALCYIVPAAIVKVCIGSPKMAWNE